MTSTDTWISPVVEIATIKFSVALPPKALTIVRVTVRLVEGLRVADTAEIVVEGPLALLEVK